MRAVVCRELGALDRLAIEEMPTPDPGVGEVRIAVEAAGASYVDALQVAGRYQFPQNPPYVPGGESAGVIDAVGPDVEGWHVGDRVLASAPGAFADVVLARPKQLIRLPDRLDTARGASFLQVYGTAWFAFTRRTQVREGETVLVTGAGGGVGLAAIDVATSFGARVIGVASTPEKRDLARAMGAFATIDPSSEDVKVRARELTEGRGIDVVYDVTGGPVSEAALRALRFDGRFVVIGFTAGIAKVPLNLALLNNRTIVGVEWGGWVQRHPDANRSMIDEIIERIADGTLRPVDPVRRRLDEAATVCTELLERRATGKIVLVP